MTKFKLNPTIIKALETMSRQTGLTAEIFLENVLAQYIANPSALSHLSPLEQQFVIWATKELPINERIYKTESFNSYFANISPKMYSNWIDRFAKLKGYTAIYGRSMQGRWVILADETYKAKEVVKKVTQADFFKWAKVNIDSSKKIFKKECMAKFVSDHHSVRNWLSQKLFIEWLTKYADLIGYSASWNEKHESMLFIIKDKYLLPLKTI